MWFILDLGHDIGVEIVETVDEPNEIRGDG
jgi:hypothetical protein